MYTIHTLKNGHRFAKLTQAIRNGKIGSLIPNQGRLTPGKIATDEEIEMNFQDWLKG